MDTGSGWIQAAELTIKNSLLPLKLPENISGPLRDGYLRVDGELFEGTVPMPLTLASGVELEILFSDGERISFIGDGVALLPLGEARYVEEFRPSIKPL